MRGSAVRLSATDLRRIARQVSPVVALGGEQLRQQQTRRLREAREQRDAARTERDDALEARDAARQQHGEALDQIIALQRQLAALQRQAAPLFCIDATTGAVWSVSSAATEARQDAVPPPHPSFGEAMEAIARTGPLHEAKPAAVPEEDAALQREAHELFASGMRGRAVAEELDLPLDTVSTWAAEWTAEQRAATQL